MNTTLQLSSRQDLSIKDIQNLIITLPNRPKAMLDKDLAQIYGVETKALNQAVKRNPKRFPADFMFQATDSERESLRSQSVTANMSRVTPYLFTQFGANQLSTVLHSDIAIDRSIQIMRAFSAMEQQQQIAQPPQSVTPPQSVIPIETLTTAIFENPGILLAIHKKTCSGNRAIEFIFSTMLPVRSGGAVEMTQMQYDKVVETFMVELKYFLAKGFDVATFGTTKIEIAAEPPKTTEEKLNMLEEMQAKYFKALEERDEALKTKSAIGDRKTASAMSKAAHLAIKNKKLLEEIKRLKKQVTEKTLF